MNEDIPPERLERLRARLRHWFGPRQWIGALLEAGAPLGVLGAQCLWVAQPLLGRFLPHQEIDDLARLLSDPKGMAWLRGVFESEE